MPDGWENRQIVFIVRVEAKQQFLSEIPYVGAILSLVSARIPHTNDSPPKAVVWFGYLQLIGPQSLGSIVVVSLCVLLLIWV